jgi:hypothetical protein
MDIPIQGKTKANNKRKIPSSTTDKSSNNNYNNNKKPKAAPFSQLQAELDELPIDVLLERMKEAVESERWERKHQLIGSTIALHAVNDATASAKIREKRSMEVKDLKRLRGDMIIVTSYGAPLR